MTLLLHLTVGLIYQTGITILFISAKNFRRCAADEQRRAHLAAVALRCASWRAEVVDELDRRSRRPDDPEHLTPQRHKQPPPWLAHGVLFVRQASGQAALRRRQQPALMPARADELTGLATIAAEATGSANFPFWQR